MKKNYIIAIALVVLVAGAGLIFGMGKKAEAPISPSPVMCTMDAKLCPDGSYVGRTGPKCEFSACPEVKDKTKDTTSTGALKAFTVSGQNFSFTPSLITAKKGDRVKITFKNTSGFHDFRIDEYGVATKQTKSPTTEVLEFTADKAGSFVYYCSVGTHRAMGMWGTLKVE